MGYEDAWKANNSIFKPLSSVKDTVTVSQSKKDRREYIDLDPFLRCCCFVPVKPIFRLLAGAFRPMQTNT